MDADTSNRFITDVKAGVPDEELMKKYGLQGDAFYRHKAAALDILAEHKAATEKAKVKINGRKFLYDIKAGMDDEALMEKYKVSKRQLQSLFRQLIESDLTTPLELANRLRVTTSQVTEAFVEMGKAVKELD
ncbi:MAG: hypothetical protein ACLQPD_24210 [Desulfomonilaceae bacterium]